jgi:CMP/dCMP kinase
MSDVVAIDGPSASGKSTVARRVAAELGFLYVDSGAMYRGVTWKALREGVNAGDGLAVARMLARVAVETLVVEGAVRFRLDGTDPLADLRGREVTDNVSLAAAVPAVRARVNEWLRDAVRFGDLVVEGRDIGTAVFPGTPFKFYLDAAPGERARRRLAETDGARGAAAAEDVERSLQRRDRLDSGRDADPLRVPPGAVVVDTTRMSVDEVARLVVREVRRLRRKT